MTVWDTIRMTVIPEDQRPLADVVAEIAEYLESLEETVAIASDPELVTAIAEGEADAAAGRVYDAEEIEAEFRNRS